MRDPNRIDNFLQELGKIWKTQCPDWRFNQFVINIYETMPFIDPYGVEDDEMMDRIKKYFNIKEEE